MTTVQFWPRHKPIPAGWRDTGADLGHHGDFSILIEREAVMVNLTFATFHPGCACEMNLVIDGKITRVPVNYQARLHIRGKFLRADRHPLRPYKLKFPMGEDLIDIPLTFHQRRNIEEVFRMADRHEYRDAK